MLEYFLTEKSPVFNISNNIKYMCVYSKNILKQMRISGGSDCKVSISSSTERALGVTENAMSINI